MPKTPMDAVGRAISPAARAVRDAKLQAPEDNKASDKTLAQAAAMHVSRFVTRTENARIELDDKFNVLYAQWNGRPLSRYVTSARSVHVPEPYKAVEAFVGRIVAMLIGSPNWFRVVGIDEQGQKNSDTIRDLIRTQLRLDNFPSKFTTVVRNCAIFGYCPAKVGWELNTTTKKFNKVIETPVEEDGVETGTAVTLKRGQTEEINRDGPVVEPIDMFDFYTDLRFADHQKSPGVAFRGERDEQYVRQCQERRLWKNVDALLSLETTPKNSDGIQGPTGGKMAPGTMRHLRDIADGTNPTMGSSEPVSRLYEVWEYWGKFDTTTHKQGRTVGKEKEYVITIARRMGSQSSRIASTGGTAWQCVRIAEQPYWHGMRPVVVAHYTRRSHAFQSMGMIEPISKLSMELDDRRNMALAAAALSVRPPIAVDHSFDLFPNQTVLDFGTILRGNPEGIKAVHVPNRAPDAYQAEQAIKTDIRETTGMISQLQGMPGEKQETATAHVSYIREANKRVQEVARNLSEHFLKPMLEMMYSMNEQMITKERLVEVLGEDGLVAGVRKITPADVTGKVHFEVEAMPQIEMAGIEASMMNNFADTALKLMQAETALDAQEVQAGKKSTRMIDLEALLRKMWVKQFGHSDEDEIFPRAKKPRQYRAVREEHELIAHGSELEPQMEENLYAHMAGHTTFMETDVFADWDEDGKRRMYAHVENTKLALERFLTESMARVPPGMEGLLGQSGMPPQAMQMQGQPGAGGQASRASPTPTGQVRSAAAGMEPREPMQ